MMFKVFKEQTLLLILLGLIVLRSGAITSRIFYVNALQSKGPSLQCIDPDDKNSDKADAPEPGEVCNIKSGDSPTMKLLEILCPC